MRLCWLISPKILAGAITKIQLFACFFLNLQKYLRPGLCLASLGYLKDYSLLSKVFIEIDVTSLWTLDQDLSIYILLLIHLCCLWMLYTWANFERLFASLTVIRKWIFIGDKHFIYWAITTALNLQFITSFKNCVYRCFACVYLMCDWCIQDWEKDIRLISHALHIVQASM